ncbi:MAG: sel1 repeat family protein, partial [Candidatus Cloacimonetes bacterium]|nr:sel1 repeat family protein [Candidatus Cloacimonadota bacterium]
MSRINLPQIYNPHNQTPQELIANFVVRLGIFKELFDDIKASKMKYPEQQYIIQGLRGQGKTTLLLRLAYEIENDNKLSKWLIPIVFSEEQHRVRKLYKLWELTAECLQEYEGFTEIVLEMQKINDDDDYEINCFQLLENRLKKSKKKIILFIDNINDMFDKFTKKDHHRLREVLIESCELRIIGASASCMEFHYKYDEPFYEFFRILKLKGLSLEETKKLLLKLGENYKRDRVRKIVEEQSGRIESLRRITDGVIRTIVLLFGIFVDEEEGNAFVDLEDILDKVTLLYKDRMDHLSAQQQEIVDFIALSWDAVSTKEIAIKSKEDSKSVSSQLKVLIKHNIIEQQKTNTKNNLYRLSERFFNIWYLMRHGGKKEENKVKWLVEFLQEWCDEDTLATRANIHIKALKKGNIHEKQAYYMTEALALCSIDRTLQHEMKKQTRLHLSNKHSDLLKNLQPSDIELKQSAIKSMNKKDINQFIGKVEKIRNKDVDDWKALGKAYINQQNYHEAAKSFEKAAEKGDAVAMFSLAVLYHIELKDFKKAEKHYLMAVEKEHAGAMFNLAILYEIEFKNFEKAEKYYLLAVEKEIPEAMHYLANLYRFE